MKHLLCAQYSVSALFRVLINSDHPPIRGDKLSHCPGLEAEGSNNETENESQNETSNPYLSDARV